MKKRPDLGRFLRFVFWVHATRSYFTAQAVDEDTVWLCNALLDAGGAAPLWSNVLMQEHVLIWDLQNRQLGFAVQDRSQCPPALEAESAMRAATKVGLAGGLFMAAATLQRFRRL